MLERFRVWSCARRMPEGPVERLFERLAAAVRRRPGVTVAVALAVTLGFAAAAPFAEQDDGVTVDDERSAALETIEEVFGDPQAVAQIVVEATDGEDVRRVEALRLTRDLEAAVADSELADTVVASGEQPPFAPFLGPADGALEQAPIDLDDLSDEELRELQADAVAQLPEQVAGLFDGLVSDDDPPSAGLVLVFQDASGLGEDGVAGLQAQLAEVVADVAVPAGLEVTTFSFPLLLTGSDIGPEVGRLFGTALLIILLVLSVVFWVAPGAVSRWRIGRRTAADVGLTLLVIVAAVVWMQGAGVLLGPGFAGLIGPFSPQTQIVPILIVGLGVDFAIHLLARYRTEVGSGADPDRALTTSHRTIGVTLLLCTAATAIGFLTNLASPVDFLATLGVLAAIGIVAAFVLTLTLLPAARLLLDRRAVDRGALPTEALATQTSQTLPRLVSRTAWLAERAPVPTLVVALAATALGGYGFTQLDSQFELTDFVPQDEPLLATLDLLEDRFDGGFEESTEVLLRGPLDDPEVHDTLLTVLDDAAEVDAVDTLAGEVDDTSLRSVLATARDGDLADELAELGIAEDLTAAQDADLGAVHELLREDTEQGPQVVATLEDGTVLSRVTLRTSAGQSQAGALADDLAEAFAPLTETGVEVVPTSQEIVQAGIADDIEDTQLLSLVIALGAAMALLVLHYTVTARRPAIGVLTVLPVAVVLALTFGTMALTGIPLNPVTATLAALSIGIGVPFTIHITSRFLEERDRGTVDGQPPLRRAVARTGGALAGSALTTAIGFGVLITSTLVPFEQLGYVIVYAIVYSFAAAVLVLPSLLALWDRTVTARARGDATTAPAVQRAGR